MYRKDAITNVQIKPHSNINPQIVSGVFKGFLVRAHRLCSPNHLQDEIEFLIDVFTENGHARSNLENIVNGFVLPEHRSKIPTDTISPTSANKTATTTSPSIRLPWIPQLGPRLRTIFKKHNINTVFTSTPNLKSILCNNKSKLPTNSQAGVYKITCSCGSSYIGETKKKISTRLEEHQKDIRNGKWLATGCAEHSRDCDGNFNWEENVTIGVEPDFHHRKIREALEIRRFKTGPDQPMGLNRDMGNITHSNSWNALFSKM